MLKIGEFSKVGRVSIKTLRYYDSIGLLVPDKVNESNGYRYYSPKKLVELSRIQQFKEAGFALEVIDTLTGGSLTEKETKTLLEEQITVVDAELAAARSKRQQVERLLANLRREKDMEKITIQSLPRVTVASKRITIPTYDALYREAPRMGEVMKKQGAVCAKPAYCFNIYHDDEYRESDIDLEICEAVVEARSGGEGVVYKEIPRVDAAACVMHRGPYETLGESYGQIYGWMEDNGFEAIDKCRESYIDGPWNKKDPALWLTEIQIPVKKSE